jgi:hypothetical protein
MAADIVLHASGAETLTGTGAAFSSQMVKSTVSWELDVTDAATEAGDTLNVFIQTKIGDDWLDVVHFTELIGSGGAKRFYAKQTVAVAETMFENGTALAAGAVRNLIGSDWRCRWAIVDVATTSNQSFTFSLKGARDT